MTYCVDTSVYFVLLNQFTNRDKLMKKYITEDGYIFVLMPNGTLTDGDMVFDSLDALKVAMDIDGFSVEPAVFLYSGNRNPLEN